ncbi:MAG: glycine oxidase ThiO [Planctomycetes bacterium]|nr:glycine oxidase ThiO [Planctomycetota bacterium]
MSATDKSPDVLVIGGGIIGCTTAYRLAQAGLAVTIVERGVCGREASWAGAGIIYPGSELRTDFVAQLRRAAIARFPDFVAELRERTGIDPQFVRCGSLDIITDDNQDAAADREVAAAVDHKTNTGEPFIERLTPRQAREHEPNLTPKIRGAVLMRETAQVRNPRLMAALRAACAQAGVKLLEQTAVLDLLVDGARVGGVQTARGPIAAGKVVLAAGAWSSSIDRRLAGLIEVFPVRGQIVLLEMLPRVFTHFILHGRSYLASRLDGKIIVGSTEEPEAGFDKSNTVAGVARLLRVAERFMPRLKDATLLRTWAGLRPGTPDSKPYLGPVPGLEGLIAATGHYRSGLTLAPITADLITQYITQGKTDIDLEPFRPGRPQNQSAKR